MELLTSQSLCRLLSTYEPKYCEWSKLIPYPEMLSKVKDARIVITHGQDQQVLLCLCKNTKYQLLYLDK